MKNIIKNQWFLFWILPLILGLSSSFSLPPYNFIIINFITFPFLLFIVFNLKVFKKKPIAYFKVGWLFGFSYFLSNLYWIAYSLTYEEIFKIFIPLAIIIIPSLLAIFYGLAILFLIKINIKKIIASLITFSLAVSILDFIRSTVLTGFPWNLISFSWLGSINSLQVLSLIGTYSFNLISITLFTLPFVFFFKNYKKTQFYVSLFLILIISFNYLYGFQKLKEINNESYYSTNYKIKIISPKISIDRFIENVDEENILFELINLSSPERNVPTIFIWPEGIFSGIDFNQLQEYKNLFLSNFSKNHIIIMGINSHDNINKIYNSMIIVDNNLKILSQYNKNKLVPFGEFLPFERFFNKIGFKKITKGYQSFTKGKERNIIYLNHESFNLKFLPLICYEIIYSGYINSNYEKFDFIINISEDGWFNNSIGPDQHFSHSIFRAIEEGVNIIRSANNGISAYIDPGGKIIQSLESTQRGVIELSNFKKPKNTYFSSNGNKIFFYFVLLYIILIFFLNKKEKQ